MSTEIRSVKLMTEVDTNKSTRCQRWDQHDLDALVGELAENLFAWNSTNDPYFVINGRPGESDPDDPYAPIVRAVLNAIIYSNADGAVE